MVRMLTMRVLSAVAVAVLLILSTACRRKSPSMTTQSTPPPSDAAAVQTPAAPVPSLEPANVPTGSGSTIAPSEKDDPAKTAAKTQNRFNRNSVWMAKLGKNDPQVRAQVLAEIQKAGLSPAELQELRKQAQMYGIQF